MIGGKTIDAIFKNLKYISKLERLCLYSNDISKFESQEISSNLRYAVNLLKLDLDCIFFMNY